MKTENKNKTLTVEFGGTRGSTPISNKNSIEFGGNTTAVRVQSRCIPENTALCIDAGTGYIPIVDTILSEGKTKIITIFTHWHHDHTQGLPLSMSTFRKDIKKVCYGPIQYSVGTKDVLTNIMKKPYFPVDFKEVSSAFECHNIEYPNITIFLIHPEHGEKKIAKDLYDNIENSSDKLVKFGTYKVSINECLVIKMVNSNHPEDTISYRFEERPTGKVFVFLTDHENQAVIPNAMKMHLKDADLLVMDVQYDEFTYENFTAGFGHGTPSFAVKAAELSNAKVLGLTHHDPKNDDEKIKSIYKEALGYKTEDSNLQIVSLKDYDIFTV